MKVSIYNHLDDVTPTVKATSGSGADNEAPGFPASNAQARGRSDVWRSFDTGGTGGPLATTEWKYSYGADRGAAAFYVFRHNLAGCTVQLQLYSDAGWTTQVYDSTALTVAGADSSFAGASYGLSGTSAGSADDLFGNQQPHKVYFDAVAFRSVKITVVSGGALATADDFFEIGRLWLALPMETVNPSYGLALSDQANTSATRSRGGSLVTNVGETWRRLDMNFGSMPVAGERAFWKDVSQFSQTAKDIVVDVFDDDTSRLGRDYLFNGQVVSLDPLIYGIGFHTEHIVVEEL